MLLELLLMFIIMRLMHNNNNPTSLIDNYTDSFHLSSGIGFIDDIMLVNALVC